jgi:hypothetical protein
MKNKKIITTLLIITLTAITSPVSAKTQGPDILQGKTICIAKMENKIAYIDCDTTYTAHKKIGTKDIYLLRDRKQPSWLMICKTKKLKNCKIVAN